MEVSGWLEAQQFPKQFPGILLPVTQQYPIREPLTMNNVETV